MRSETRDGIIEEVPEACKDVDAVIEVAAEAGLARKGRAAAALGAIEG